MSRTTDQSFSEIRRRTNDAKKCAAELFREVLNESGTTIADLARRLGVAERTAQKWCTAEVALPAFLLHDSRLPAGFRKRLALRLLSEPETVGAPSTLRLVHVATTACAVLTAENDNARPAIALLHDETGRWLRSLKEAA